MIQITRSGTVFSGSAIDLACLRTQFEKQHCICLPKLFDPGLLHLIQRHLNGAVFYNRIHEGIGSNKELCLQSENPTLSLLHFLVNSSKLFETIQEITQCQRIGFFLGRVYRNVPGSDHHDAWHDDMVGHRLIAMSVNLSTEVYSGGILEMRDRKSGQIVHRVTNIGLGDAIIFRLAAHLQHRRTEVEGTVPKTAFAGWFCSQPEFLTILKNGIAENSIVKSL